MQTQGGVWASFGDVFGNPWPINHSSLAWPFGSSIRLLTGEYGGLSILTIRFALQATWRVDSWGVWWIPFGQTAQERLKNKSNKVLGGPGIRTHVPMIICTRPCHSAKLFQLLLWQESIIILVNKQIWWKQNKTRADSN